jgi:hypothetical protein
MPGTMGVKGSARQKPKAMAAKFRHNCCHPQSQPATTSHWDICVPGLQRSLALGGGSGPQGISEDVDW